MRPKIERENRKCFICLDEIENEIHFLTNCRIYEDERDTLYKSCRENCNQFEFLQTNQQIFIFILSNENTSIIKALARFVDNAFKLRDTEYLKFREVGN